MKKFPFSSQIPRLQDVETVKLALQKPLRKHAWLLRRRLATC